uniref:RING-type domain-containing protein n=1 Tax=Syphacia muris TaxID=451379 RepID=A0A0N5AMX6_9BILA
MSSDNFNRDINNEVDVKDSSSANCSNDCSGESDYDEEEEVLLEPRFRYSRILNSIPSILAKDSASCMTIHDKFIAIGSHAGYIYIFDHLGNLHSENTVKHHKSSITNVVIDGTGGYMISCASDAVSRICSVGSTELNQTLDLKTPAKCLAISPNFAKRNSGHGFITGDKNLVLHEHKIFFNYRSNVLYQGIDRDGYILQVSWHENYILFTNNTGSRLYDKDANRIMALVQANDGEVPMHSLKSVPSHCWISATSFVIGWMNTITVCAIVSTEKSDLNYCDKRVEVHYSWKLDMYVADVSFTLKDLNGVNDWAEIVAFGMKKSVDDEGKVTLDVVLTLLEPDELETFVLSAEDRIEMRNCEQASLRDIHMRALPYESSYFLLGPKDFIEAKPCSADDRVRWYVENGMLREAMHYANEHESELVEISSLDIGKEYLSALMSKKKFSQAAAYLRLVCGRKKEQWEYYVNEFERYNVVLQLAKYIPTKDPQLEPESYQSILIAALYNHPLLFSGLVKAWNPDIYRVGAITDMAMERVMNDRLNKNDAISIYKSLAILYTYERKYEQALKLYLSMNDKNVFSLIERYLLFDMVKNDIAKLMQIDSTLALRLLIDNVGSLKPKNILSQLSKFPKFQLAYLNQLFERNEGEEFADLAVALYAEHEPEKLLPFLRKSESYDMAKALKICERKDLINEMVFLLGRSGNLMRALNLLVEKLNRIDLAIDFCLETDDLDLWDALIESSMNNPERVTKLLNIAGHYIDPLSVIEKIPCDMVIPGLRESLTKILQDYEVQVHVQNGCTLVTQEDCNNLLNKYVQACNRPISVKSTSLCVICGNSVLFDRAGSDKQVLPDFIAFGCSHVIHEACIDRPHFNNEIKKCFKRMNKKGCPICSGDKIVAKLSHVIS